jgi:hypothetical protein
VDIPEGSKLGALMEGAEKTAAEVYMGRAIPVGPLRGIPVWDASSGVRVLFLLPLSGCMVKKSGRRQGGAFLLGPGESFSLRGTAQEETVFQFKAASAVEVIPGTGALCGFCRAPLAEGVPGCLSLTPGNPLAGKVLCLPCAQAWEIFVSP